MEQKVIQIEEGKYAISLQALKKDENEISAMANYLSQMAVVTKEGKVFTLSLLLQSEKTITGLQVENEAGEFIEAIDRQVDHEMERRYEMFQLTCLPAILKARVQYEVEHEGKSFQGDELLRLSFDESSLEALV